MKKLIEFNQAVGSDGAQAAGALGVEGANLKAQVEVTYPIEKVVAPATKAVDSLLDKVKKAIPGNWDDAVIDQFKVEYKEELVQLLSE